MCGVFRQKRTVPILQTTTLYSYVARFGSCAREHSERCVCGSLSFQMVMIPGFRYISREDSKMKVYVSWSCLKLGLRQSMIGGPSAETQVTCLGVDIKDH